MPPRRPPARTISVLGLPPLLSLARERGVDGVRLLAAARIPAAWLADPAARVPLARERALVRALLDATGDAALGLAAGQRYHLTAFGLLGSVVPAVTTPREAIRLFLDHLHLTYTPFAVDYRERGGEGALRFVDDDELGDLRRFYLDRDLVFVLETAATLWPGAYRRLARRVAFDYPEPPEADRYRALAPCPVEFGAPVAAAVLDPALLDLPRPQASPLALRLLEEHLRAFVAPGRADTPVARVRRAVALAVADGDGLVGEDAVAAALGTTARHLRRQLAAAGARFRAVRDDVVAQAARRHLRASALTVAALAERLGYGEAASFVRAFRRWTGTTPERYRRGVTAARAARAPRRAAPARRPPPR